MAEEIKAWRAKDGSIHQSQLAAKDADLQLALDSIGPLTLETVNQVMAHRSKIYDALNAYYLNFLMAKEDTNALTR